MTYAMAEDWVRRGLAVLIEKTDREIVIETMGQPLNGEKAPSVCRFKCWR